MDPTAAFPLPTPDADAPAGRHWSPWSTYRVVLIVVAGLIASAALHLKLSYDKALRDAQTLIGAITVASEQHIGGNLAGIDSLLDELAATVREGRHHDPRFSNEFAARLASFPELRFIGIIGADGALQPDSWPPYRMSPDGINLAHRPYFSAQRDATGPAAMLVGEPAYGFATEERIMHLSRPVHDRAGRFTGVVFAAVNPDAYGAFLSSILHDDAGMCSLISLGGHVVARSPDPADEYGRNVGDSQLFRQWLPQAPAGMAEVSDEGERTAKLLSYRVMPEFSLMVTASIPRSKVLAAWTRMAVIETVLLSTFCGMLLYWASRIRRNEAILNQQQRLMEAAVEERSRDLETARALAESRAARLGWINEELKRLTLVTSHHLQEPLRAIVSCGQMIPRALAARPPGLDDAVNALTQDGIGLKARLGEFERHVAALTSAMHNAGQTANEAEVPPFEDGESGETAPSPRYTARAIAAVIIAALLVGNVWQVRNDYLNSIQSAETLTSAVVKSIERHLQASLRRIDTLLADVAQAVEAGRHVQPEFRDRLVSRMETIPEIRQIAVADANGRSTRWAWSVDGAEPPPRDISDRDFFRRQVQAPQPGRLVIGNPRPVPADGNRLLSISQPLLGATGQFAGIVFATLDADFYARYLNTLLMDENGASALLSLDGRILARAPRQEEKFAADISTSDLFTRFLPQAAAGIAHLHAKADGNAKLLGYRSIDGFPVLVTSGYSLDKALAQWRVVAVVASAVALAAAVVLFAWAWGTDRHALALARYRRRLAQEVRLRTAGLAAAHAAAEMRSSRLDDANERMRDLIHMIAAEMQVPLRALSEKITTVEHLAAGKSEEADHWLHFITAGGVHLRALLRDCQRFVAALSETPRLRPLDSGEVIRGAASLITGMWGDRVTFDIGPLPRLMADRDMLLELFLQLFANSVIHAKDRPHVAIAVTAELQENGWCFTVSDDGPGLPPVNNDQLFRAFETAHGRDPDSTGLGLPLCRVIVQWHGGRIWATSRLGKGCDIHFVLPDAGDDRFALVGNSTRA